MSIIRYCQLSYKNLENRITSYNVCYTKLLRRHFDDEYEEEIEKVRQRNIERFKKQQEELKREEKLREEQERKEQAEKEENLENDNGRNNFV